MSNNFSFPPVLSFCKSIMPGVGYFKSKNNNEVKPILVSKSTVRGTFTNYNSSDIADIVSKKKYSTSNIQEIEIANLPKDFDTLLVEFGLNIQSKSLKSHATSDLATEEWLGQLVSLYNQKDQSKKLSRGYVTNIVTGRWLFRNDYGSDKTIRVITEGETFEFNYTSTNVYTEAEAVASNEAGFNAIVDLFHQALFTEDAVLNVKVEGEVTLFEGASVFPSEEFVDNKKELSKVLSSEKIAEGRIATLHTQKIGNAIRTIDSGYKDAYKPLPVEPYGIDHSTTRAIRAADKEDFYTLVEKNIFKWIEELNQVESVDQLEDSRNIHFVVACLIRGGVYSGASKKK